MDLRSIYLANGIGVFILIILLFVSRAKILRRRVEDKIFFLMVVGVMFGCIKEVLSYSVDGQIFPGARVINYIANTYLYTVNLALPFLLMVYVDIGLYGDQNRTKKKYRPQIIVGTAMFCLTILNFFVPVVYYISEQNVYERRPLSYVYYIVILYFCITAMFVTRKYEKENGSMTFFSVHMFLLPILIGAGLQFMFYGLSLAWLSAAIGLVGLFMMQQNEIAYVDPLVDTYNRQYMNSVFSSWTKRGDSFSGAMIDVDWFKSINDRYGHSEGDKALRDVAHVLKKSRIDNELVFRFAGDEFVVFKRESSEDGMKAYMKEVERQLAEHNKAANDYKLSLSYGISHFESGDLDSFLKEMDEGMYDMKATHHRS